LNHSLNLPIIIVCMTYKPITMSFHIRVSQIIVISVSDFLSPHERKSRTLVSSKMEIQLRKRSLPSMFWPIQTCPFQNFLIF
jgi:hypothetical protein